MSRNARWAFAVAIVAFLITPLAGCHRAYYRTRADAEAYALVNEKANHAHWPLENYTVQVAPTSRMFYPFDPDRPPMPPDDPASHRFMHQIDGRRAYPHWDDNGFTPHVESPVWEQYLPVNEEGVLELTAARAVELALLHSSDYQEELETLYLSALDVSAERFRFDYQFFGGYSLFYTATGPDRAGAGGESSSVLESNLFSLGPRPLAISRTFTTGADLVVGLANSLIWQFSGPDTSTATTLVDFALVQPLLRGAGRDRVLETLTIAERALLANVRQMERFRRGFYTEVITGTGRQQGPSRRGGVFGGSGLAGFAGVGGGGFGQVGGGRGGAGGGATGAAGAGGFMGLLQNQQNIRNLESNIVALRSSLAQLEAFYEAGRINFFQVELARQDLFQNQSLLLNARRAYQDQLDAFKLQLGLPPQLDLEIDDPLLDPFNLIDPVFLPIQTQLSNLQDAAGDTIVGILSEVTLGVDAEPELEWSPAVGQRLEQLQGAAEAAEQLQQRIMQEIVANVREDLQALPERLERRQTYAEQLRNKLAEREALGEQDAVGISPELFDTSPLEQLPAALTDALNRIEQRLVMHAQRAQDVQQNIQQLLEAGPALAPPDLLESVRNEVFDLLPTLLNDLSADVLDLSLVQARARAELITLVPVDITAATALEIARHYRRDWMNARASLVDAWRLIEFNADNLESQLNVVFSGDLQNIDDNPFSLRGTTGRLRVGLQFDAPLTRLLERNTYRQALLEYHQARRSYYRFEDAVASDLRATVRQIELNQINFELRRAALRVAANQVESARLQLQEPPPPGQEQLQAAFGENTARDLVQALASLRGAQDDFLSVWVNYEVLRRLLDLNMGTMELDGEGIWLDPGPIGLQYGYPVNELPAPEPIEPGLIPCNLLVPLAEPEVEEVAE